MKKAIFARKVGMMSVYEGKNLLPVTVLEAFRCTVLRKKNMNKDGYNAVIVNYGPKLKKKKKSFTGAFSNLGVDLMKYLKEVKFDTVVHENIKEGNRLDVTQFSDGDLVTVTGISIGKGFCGAMKRHNFAGLEASHGVSVSHRSHGSTGGCQEPGKVFKGKKMAGHMGARKVTVKGITVTKVDPERNLIIVKGSVPGAKSSTILLKSLT